MKNFKAFGKYTILKKIATGGMAEIFLASDSNPTGHSRFIVIKRALSQYSDNEEFKDMFKNEGKVASNLKHRNIAPVYDFGIYQNQFYLAMEHISGRNLRELIRKLRNLKKPVDVRYSAHIIKEAASGLNYAHNVVDQSTGQPLNLIHRDVSPQNIMISFDGEIRLIDFGISKVSDTDLTRAGHLKGKFSYMSPEQAKGEELDGRTDIFCLGIILWELLSGQRLFASKNEMDALKKIRNCNIPDIQNINPHIPTELAKIVNTSLQKNKNLRYKTAAELEKDLNIFLNKNYPEFSQYDFMSYVREVYSKEMINEREDLKNFSKEIKDYNENLFTIEKEMSIHKQEEKNINYNLDIPNIDTTLENDKENQTNELSNYITHAAETLKKGTDSTFVLKGKNYDSTNIKLSKNETQTEISKTIKTTDDLTLTKNSTVSKNLLIDDLDIIKEQEKALQQLATTRNTNSKSFKNKTSQIYTDELITTEQKSQLIKNTVAFLTLILISFSSYYGFKNRNKIIHSELVGEILNTNTKVKEKTQDQNTAAEIKSKNKPPELEETKGITKVFLNTKPSGALIQSGNKTLGATPLFLNVDSDKEIQLKIIKQGYFPKVIQRQRGAELGKSLNILLQKKEHDRKPSNVTTIIQ